MRRQALIGMNADGKFTATGQVQQDSIGWVLIPLIDPTISFTLIMLAVENFMLVMTDEQVREEVALNGTR